jgi:hypothetical protein
MFGSLSPLFITTEKPLLAKPQVTYIMNTYHEYLYSVACLNKEKVWTCGASESMKLRNLKDELLSRLQAGNTPTDIAVTQDGDLVFINYMYSNKTVNIVRNRIIHV